MNRRFIATIAVITALAAGAFSADPKPAPVGFDDMVPAREVRAALIRLDAMQLASTAAKVAAAEDKLGRPRPGVPAILLYETAIRVAAERRHLSVLDRLAADPYVKGHPKLVALVAAARLAARASRASDPEMVVALDQITPEQFALFRGYLTQIQDAKVLADKDALESLATHVTGVLELTNPQKKFLAKRIEAVRKDLPAEPPAAAVAARTAQAEAVKEESTPAVAQVEDTKDNEPPPGNMTANETAPDKSTDKSTESPPLVDEGFEGRIDVAKIGKAWSRADAVALADYAIRMAEEERILGRQHRHLPANKLFEACHKLAVQNGDLVTVGRLEKTLKAERSVEFTGKEEFLAKLTNSQGLVASSRKGREPFLASIDQVSPESFVVFRDYLSKIRAAGAQRDTGMLNGLVEGLETVVELDDAQRAYLNREATEALKGVGPVQLNELAVSLRLLAGESRTSLPDLNRKILAYCQARIGRKVDNGECAMLAVRAMESAGAHQFPPSGLDADYVWGRHVKSTDALPGDIIQFRNVLIKITQPNGAWQQWTYGHHTAVISEVNGKNRFTVLQQNVGSAGKSADKKKIVQVGYIDLTNLKSGQIWVYRPVR